MTSRYDTIGINYSDLRKPDPRIAAAVEAALGDAALHKPVTWRGRTFAWVRPAPRR